ncbi:MAG: YitT family protein [Eubacteriales bacterium]|nr:YitT family protein [Eubacteriales bacterium]
MKTAKKIFGILIGNFILAFGIAAFVLPQGLITGGVTGISIVLRHYFDMDLNVAVWILDVVLFLMGAAVMGKKFALTVIVSTATFPMFLSILTNIPALQTMTQDRLLSAIYAGILMGLAIGIVIRQGASTGGMDIPPLILNKKFGIPVAFSLYVGDFIILLLQALFSDQEQILYGILMVLIYSFVLNYVLLMGEKKLQLIIISEKYSEIRKELLDQADVGATMMYIQTGYEKKDQQAILCVIAGRRLHEVSEIIKKTDPGAFFSVAQINEVKGRGFTMERKYLEKNPDKKQRQIME